MKKIILIAGVLAPFLAFAFTSPGGMTVPQGGTGNTYFPYKGLIIGGSSSLRLESTTTPEFSTFTATSTTATSTAANGINLTGGCFSVGGNCIISASGGAVTGSGASGEVTYWTGASAVSGNPSFSWDNSNGRLGIGTTTPATTLSVNQKSATDIGMYLAGYANATADLFRVSTTTTATSTAFVINGSGNVGIGTSTPGSVLSIAGVANFLNGTSTLYGNLDVRGDARIGGHLFQPITFVAGDTVVDGTFRTTGNTTIGTLNGIIKGTTGLLGTATVGTDYIAGGVGANTQVAYFTNSGVLSGDANLTFTNGNLLTATYASSTSISTSQGAYFATTGGNVGIGTVSPVAADGSSRTLQLLNTVVLQNVVGTQALFSNNAYYDGTWKYMTTATAAAMRVGALAAGDISFHAAASGTAGNTITNWDGTDIRMVIKNTGNVGIGTTSPMSLLSVQGSATNNGTGATHAALLTISNSRSATGSGYAALDFRTDENDGQAQRLRGSIFSGIDSGGSNVGGFIGFATPSTDTGSTLAERMRITNGGNVGIGTTVPVSPLNVNGVATFGAGSDGTGVTVSPTSITATQASKLNLIGYGSENEWVGFNQYYDGAWKPVSSASAFQIYHSGTNLVFYGDSGLTKDTGYTPTARMTIQAAGNVGIGTTSPWSVLSVQSNGNKAFSVSTTTTETSNALFIDANGKLGIATTTSPIHNLAINGSAMTTEIQVPYAAAMTFDGSKGNQFSTTLTGDATIAFANVYPGQTIRLNIYQDSTGNRKVTSWGAIFVIDNQGTATTSPSMSTKAGTLNICSFVGSKATSTPIVIGSACLFSY